MSSIEEVPDQQLQGLSVTAGRPTQAMAVLDLLAVSSLGPRDLKLQRLPQDLAKHPSMPLRPALNVRLQRVVPRHLRRSLMAPPVNSQHEHLRTHDRLLSHHRRIIRTLFKISPMGKAQRKSQCYLQASGLMITHTALWYLQAIKPMRKL